MKGEYDLYECHICGASSVDHAGQFVSGVWFCSRVCQNQAEAEADRCSCSRISARSGKCLDCGAQINEIPVRPDQKEGDDSRSEEMDYEMWKRDFLRNSKHYGEE